jgi:hypothetical protein
MVFIDGIDDEKLLIQACAYAEWNGYNLDQTEKHWKEKNALTAGFMAGYRAAIKDEDEAYQEALKKVQEWDPVDIALVISILMVGIIGSSAMLLLIYRSLSCH